jgi:hypothetical protein
MIGRARRRLARPPVIGDHDRLDASAIGASAFDRQWLIAGCGSLKRVGDRSARS